MAKKAAKTNAARILDREKIDYESLQYSTDDGKIDGVSVASKIGAPVEVVYKTLVAAGSSKNHYVFLVPVAEELDLKLAAKACGEKKVDMVPVKEILPLTGYVRGGCSPFGMKKPFRTFVANQASELNEIIVSAGKIGAQLKMAPEDLLKATKGELVELTAKS